MGVVLPGEADAAVHLDAELGVVVGRPHGEGGGARRGEGQLIAAGSGGAGGVPHGGGGQLGGDEHVGAVVLDRLEHGDLAAELLAHLGVLGGLVGAGVSDARGLRREEQAAEVEQRPATTDDDLDRGAAEGGAGGPAAAIGVGATDELEAGGVALDHDDVVTGGDHDELGEVPTEHQATVARGGGAVDGERATEADAGRGRAVDQAGEQAGGLLRRAGGGHDRAGDDGGQERARGELTAELLDHDHQLGEAEAGAAVLLRDVQAQPSELGHRRPRRGQLLRVVLEQHPGLAPQVVLDAEVGDDVGQGLVVLGDGDRHGLLP